MKTALITGGSRGIGAAAVRRFSGAGYTVRFLYEKNEAAARAMAEETGAEAVCCDVTDESAVQEAVASLGRLDALICCAGIADYGPFDTLSAVRVRHILDVNAVGPYLCAKAALPLFLRKHSGSMVFVSSMWGMTGASCEAAYSMSKAAVIGLTKALAAELGPSGIRVNAVAPGVIQTDMLRPLTEDTLEELRQSTPLEALGTPEEVADAIFYLADQAAFVTGEILNISGGFVR